MTLYRKTHPEFREQEKIKDRIRLRELYRNNPERKEAVKKRALDRYYRLKAEKEENKIQNLYENQLENSVEEFLQNFY